MPAEQSKISDLEDKLCHATREVDEVKYLLGHKIEVLEKQLKDLASTTKAIIDISDRNHYYWDLAKELIKEIESIE